METIKADDVRLIMEVMIARFVSFHALMDMTRREPSFSLSQVFYCLGGLS